MIADKLRKNLVPAGFPVPTVDEADAWLLSQGFNQETYRERLYAWGVTTGGVPNPSGQVEDLVAALDSLDYVLTWTSVGDTDGWLVQRKIDDDTEWTTVADVPTVGYTDEGIDAEAAYQYRVIAYAEMGSQGVRVYSDPSEVAEIGPQETEE